MFNIYFILGAGGVLGGVANYFLSIENKPPQMDRDHISLFVKSIFLGLVASFIVPLFLEIGQSKLIESADKSGGLLSISDSLVLFGFSLIAAVSSRQFIQSISQKVLQQAKEATEKAESAVEEVREMASDLEEDTPPDDDETSTTAASPSQINQEQRDILNAFLQKPLIRRSVTAISKEIGAAKNETIRSIDELINAGFVEELDSKKQPGQKRYKITHAGRLEAYMQTSPAPEKKA